MFLVEFLTSNLSAILIFGLILVILVLIHEFGHFIVAKKLGIKVEEFGFGFPPRAWGKKFGETLYSVNWLPIGGFVRLHGEDEAGSGRIGTSKKQTYDLKRAFFARPPGQRAAVAVAGVVMNVLLAIVIYYVFLSMSGFETTVPKLAEHRFVGASQSEEINVLITAVAPGSPAEKAGIDRVVRIVSLDGVEIDDINVFVDAVKERSGEEITLLVENPDGSARETVALVPRVNPPEGEGALGIGVGEASLYTVSYKNGVEKVFSGVTYPLNLMVYNLKVIGQFVGLSVEQKSIEPVGNAVSGPVGIFSIVSEVVQIPSLNEKILNLLNIAGLLSISLAFFNILPIPALDGGRLLFIGAEKLFGKRISMKVESYAHAIGMVLLIGLLLLVTVRDIGRLLPGS